MLGRSSVRVFALASVSRALHPFLASELPGFAIYCSQFS